MNAFGKKIRELREEAGQPLRKIAAFLGIDQAILSKMERGQRKFSRGQVEKLADYFKTEKKDLMVLWLSDKLLYKLDDEPTALKALKAAEEAVEYRIFKKKGRKALVRDIQKTLKSYDHIEKAWIYGSFSREDDTPKSDVDIALKTSSGFSYFDLGGVQFQLEKNIGRKVDIGFIDSFKDYVWEHVKSDLKLIYEKR